MRNTFVKDIRERRDCEIKNYEAKGYRVLNKATYILNDEICVVIDRIEYRFGIRVNINEVYFYILYDKSQIYLTIYDIYQRLWELVYLQGKTYLIDALGFYMKNDETAEFSYRGRIYTVHKLPSMPDDEVELIDSDVRISVREFMLLIYLIQDKSNYFEEMSSRKIYIDGLVRLLRTLLQCNAPNTVLETLGWVFDFDAGRFQLQEEKLVGKRNKKRYYLTAAEERIIL